MLDKKLSIQLFEELNESLKERRDVGEVGIVGGAVMCLVFNARESTKDIDAIFEPTKLIRDLVKKVAAKHELSSDWLNDAAKAYIQGKFERSPVMNLSHLRVWAPEANYMLAMKCISARWDTHDRDDVIFLIKHLKLKKSAQVFQIIEKYYPRKMIPPKTKFMLEEVLDE